MIRRIIAAACAAGALAAGPVGAQNAPNPNAQKQQAFAQGPHTFTGTVTTAPSGGRLVVKPDSRPEPATLTLDPSAPVFQGTGAISQEGLWPGTKVRVHYAADGRATAVEVLTADEAKKAAKEQQQLAYLPPAGAQPPGTTPPPATTPAPPPAQAQAPSPLRDEAQARSTGSQAGTILEAAPGSIALDPYQQAAGVARLQLDPSAPVFQGANRLATDALKPGADVRVFFSTKEGAQPQAVAVELLDPAEAARVRASEANVPNKSR